MQKEQNGPERINETKQTDTRNYKNSRRNKHENQRKQTSKGTKECCKRRKGGHKLKRTNQKRYKMNQINIMCHAIHTTTHVKGKYNKTHTKEQQHHMA